MSHHTATVQTAVAVFTPALDRIEVAIYRADDWFQAYVVPATQKMAIAIFIAFIRSMYLTFIAGQHTRTWFDAWSAEYILTAVPVVETVFADEGPLLIEGPRIAGLLPPAKDTIIELPREVEAPKPKRTRKPKTETKGTPAPKERKPAGIAPRKKPTTVRGVAID